MSAAVTGIERICGPRFDMPDTCLFDMSDMCLFDMPDICLLDMHDVADKLATGVRRGFVVRQERSNALYLCRFIFWTGF